MVFSTDMEMKNSRVIYTALFGGYDQLQKFKISPNIDYVCFTDNLNIENNGWKLTLFENLDGLSSVDLNRYCKFNAHKLLSEYENVIYVDSNVQLKIDHEELFEVANGHEFLLLKHSERSSLKDELEACLLYNKIAEHEYKFIKNKFLEYMMSGNDTWLSSNRLFYRNNFSLPISTLMESIWQCYFFGVKRDQLCFPPCFGEAGIEPAFFSIPEAKLLYVSPHRNEPSLVKIKYLISHFCNKYFGRGFFA